MINFSARIVKVLFFLFIPFVSFQQQTGGIELIYPKSGVFTDSAAVSFRWQKNFTNASTSFRVQFSNDSQFNTLTLDSLTTGFGISLPVTSCNLMYWRVIEESTGIVSTFHSLRAFTPACDPNITVWFKVDGDVISTSNYVSEVPNKINNTVLSATQTTAGQQPLLVQNVVNGRPIMRFDGNDALRFSMEATNNSGFSFFGVVSTGSAKSNQEVYLASAMAPGARWAMGVGSNPTEGAGWCGPSSNINLGDANHVSINRFAQLSYIKNTSKWQLYSGGQFVREVIDASMPTYTGVHQWAIGSENGAAYPLTGDVSEILIANTSMSVSQRKMIEDYLRYSYFPPANLGADRAISSNLICGNLTLSPGDYFQTYLWSNGSTGSTINATTPGTYWVTVTDQFGYVSSDTITILPPFNPNYPPGNNAVCVNQTVTWSPGFSGSNFTYQWQDNSNTSSYQIMNSGQYWFKVTDQNMCVWKSDTLTFAVDYYELNSTMGPDTSMCVGNTLALLVGANSTTNYLWPDGSSNATYAVDTTGNYFVTTTNINGCTAQDTIHVTITGQAPIADFSSLDYCFEESVDFTDLSSAVGGDNLDSWTWNFGDGNISTQQNPSHTYGSPGNYSVQLTVESQGGCKEIISKNIKVLKIPYANFTTTGFCANDSILFADTTLLGDTLLLDWSWNFGQPGSPNNISTLQNPLHLYDEFGVFNVQLSVTDKNGCFNDTTIMIQVQEAPKAIFTMNEACELDQVNFINSSSIGSPNTIVSYDWQFSDNTSSTQTNPTKIFSEYGTKTILLTALAGNGCQDTTYGFVLIHDIPYPQPLIAPACVGTFTGLFDNSICHTDTIQASEWYIDFTDNAVGDPAFYQFQSPGNHKVILVTRSEFGCQNDTLVNINVAPEMTAVWDFNPKIVVADQQVDFTYTGVNGTIFNWDFGNGVMANNSSPVLTYDEQWIGNNLPVQLIVSNGVGCLDTVTKNLEIQRGELELLVKNIFFQDEQGYLTTGVQLMNNGTVRIDSVRLVLEMSNGSQFLEFYTLPLLSGQSKIYVLNTKPSSYFSSYDDEDAWICVKGEPIPAISIAETDVTNNSSCINLEGERPILLGPNPNPVINNLKFDLLLKIETEVRVDLMNSAGQFVSTIVPLENLESGQYSFSKDISLLGAGVYYLSLKYPSGTVLKKLIIIKQ